MGFMAQHKSLILGKDRFRILPLEKQKVEEHMAIIDIKAFQCNKCGYIWMSQ